MFNSIQHLTRNSVRDAFLADDRASAAPSPASRVSPELSLELIADRAAFDALEADWNSLFDRAGSSANMFQTFNWNWHWANTYLATSPNVELAIVVARHGSRPVAILPLVIERKGILRILAWMGAPVSQYGDVLAERGPGLMPVLRECWSFAIAAARADATRLVKTRADATVAPLLAELGLTVTQQQEAPYLDMGGSPSWTAYAERYAGHGRWKNRRRQLRRMEKLGPIAVLRWTEGPDAIEPAARAIETKRAWLRERGLVSPAVADDRFRIFFETAAASVERPAGIEIAELTCNGTTAAMEITVSCRDRMAVHVLAYDKTFKECGPGNQLIEQQFARAHANGFKTYDLLAPGGGYKAEWADGSVAVLDYAAGFTLAGAAYTRLWLSHIRPALKRTIEGLPVGWRGKIAGWFAKPTTA